MSILAREKNYRPQIAQISTELFFLSSWLSNLFSPDTEISAEAGVRSLSRLQAGDTANILER